MALIFQFPYRTVAEISLSALVKNLYTLRGLCQREVIPVVKANAYGHGMVPVARALVSRGGVQMLGVATLEEAMELRRRLPHSVSILVLSGFVPHQLDGYCRYHLVPMIHSLNHLKSLQGRSVLPTIHLKLDTGMSRLGIRADELDEALGVLDRLGIKLAGLATHLAESEMISEFTDQQVASFESMAREVSSRRLLHTDARIHISNTGGLMREKLGMTTAVRPGLGLYGISPNVEIADSKNLVPILEWKTRILSFKELSEGDTVGYNRVFRASKPEKIALLPVGYADGLGRSVMEKGYVVAQGKKLFFRGRISMDLAAVDATNLTDLREGEMVTIIGKSSGLRVSVWDHADWANTIPYEILCRISDRVTRVYLD